jgi:penicillin-binding protein-related factor A (putative recombinase)
MGMEYDQNRRRIQGGDNQAAGRAFEKAIDRTNVEYTARGVARIWRMPEPTVPCGGYHRRISGSSPFDFVGVVAGQMLAMEAKHNAHERVSLPIVQRGTGLHLHQLDALVQVHRSGGLAVVVWRCGDRRTVFTGETLERARRLYHRGHGSRSISYVLGRAYPADAIYEDWLAPCLPADDQVVRCGTAKAATS